MLLTRRPLVTQLLIFVGGVVVVTILALSGASILIAQQVVGAEITQRVTAQSEITSQLLAPPLAAHDQAAVTTVLQAIVREDSLEQAVLFDPTGAVLAVQSAPGFSDVDSPEVDVPFALSAMRAGQTVVQEEADHLDVATPILVANQPVAVLVGHSPVTEAAEEVATIGLPLLLGISAVVLLLAGVLVFIVARYLTTPLRALATAAAAIGRGELETPLPAIRGGEIGALSSAFSQMTHNLQERTAAEQAAHAEALRLQQEVIHLQEANLRELSVPLIPLTQQALLLPLIGAVDTGRAAHLLETLLTGVSEQRARLVLLDLSGVRVVDTKVAQALLQAAQAVRLLGAQVALVGIRADVAHEIVATGIEVGAMPVYANLATAITTLIPGPGQQPEDRN